MLKIGDFSQLGQVSVRTLRLYDELDLLKPARIDHFTGYRYYSIDQLPRLNRIVMLKDLGFSLDQIGRLLKSDLSADQMREMLMAKQAEIEQELEEKKARLERLAMRLRQIEQEGEVSTYDVILKNVEAQRIVSMRQVVPTINDMYYYRRTLLDELYRWLEQNDIEPDGPELVIYHTAEYTDQDIDTEVAIVAGTTRLPTRAASSAAAGQVTIRELPAVQTMASVIYQGHPQDVGQAMTALFSWIGRNDFSSGGLFREIHLYGRELELVQCDPVVIELQLPVEKNAH